MTMIVYSHLFVLALEASVATTTDRQKGVLLQEREGIWMQKEIVRMIPSVR